VIKTVSLMALLTAGLMSSAFGDEKPAAKKKGEAAAAMPKPSPAPEMKELRDMIGAWTTAEKFEPSPWMPSGGTASGVNTVRLGPGGFSVLMDQRSKSAMGPFSGHGVLTWDPNDKVYRFVWVDSMSPGAVFETGRKDGDRIVFTGEATMMGKKVAVKDVIADRTPTSYTLTSYMNDGSGEKKMMSIQFTKQEAAKK
jgi:Protein of unknown function (DUF1579)